MNMKSKMDRSTLRKFHRSFKPLLYIVKISGLLPYEIREVNGNLITRRSLFGLIQSVILIVLYSGMVHFVRKENIIVTEFDGVSSIIENIRLSALELIFYVVILSAIIKQKEFLLVIKSISELDSLLVQLREEINYSKEFQRNMTIVGSFYIMNGLHYVIRFYKSYQPGLNYILHALRWCLPSFFIQITQLQFAVTVFSVKLRCSKLNDAVSKMINFANEQNWNVVPNIEIQCHNLQVNYCYHDIEGTIWNVSVVYDVICNICKTINEVFSFQTTFGLGTTSLFLTFITYEIAEFIKGGTQSYEWGDFTIDSLALLIHFITIYGIIYCCSRTKNEMDQVAILLHRVKPKRVEHREAINAFSLQSMHQKVQFTACGLFNLDYTFIYLLISTISTYMVILVQFGYKTNL